MSSQHFQCLRHHRLPVHIGIILRPPDGFDVILEQVGAFAQVRQVLIRQVSDMVLAHILLGLADEPHANDIADAARPGVQHHPHLVAFIQANLQKVVAATERASLPGGRFQQGYFPALGDPRVLFLQPLDEFLVAIRQRPQRGLVHAKTDRNRRLDVHTDLAQALGQVAGVDAIEPRGHHPAADVDSNRGGNDDLPSRDDAAHRRAQPPVHIGHDRDMMVDEWHLRDVDQLLPRPVLQRHPVNPGVDRFRPRFDVLIVRFAHGRSPQISTMYALT